MLRLTSVDLHFKEHIKKILISILKKLLIVGLVSTIPIRFWHIVIYKKFDKLMKHFTLCDRSFLYVGLSSKQLKKSLIDYNETDGKC